MFLPPNVIAIDDLDELIHEVAVNDDHYYNDVRAEVIPAKAILGTEVVNVTFTVGRGYRGKVIEEEKEIFTERLRSLQESGVSLSQQDEDGRKCVIDVSGNQLVRNYIRFYRARKEVSDGQPSFVKLRLESGGGKVLVPLLQTVAVSKESLFKYLPYQLAHVMDLFSFTVSYDIESNHYLNYEMTVSKECIPADALDSFEFGKKEEAKDNEGGDNKCKRNDMDCPNNISDNEQAIKNNSLMENPEIMSQLSTNMSHSCSHDVLDDHDTMPCYDVIEDVDARRRHLFMLIIQMQNLLLNRFHGENADDAEVCAVKLTDGAASGTGTGPPHTIVECCHVIVGRQQLFRKGQEEHGWNCHDPYGLSSVILSAVNYVAYLAWLFFPLAIASLPSDLHNAGTGRQEESPSECGSVDEKANIR